jgi:hypothetical protein
MVSSILPTINLKELPSQALDIPLLGSVGDHLSSVSASPTGLEAKQQQHQLPIVAPSSAIWS